MIRRIVYADNSATTKVRPEVVELMKVLLEEDFGNPSSIHQFGKSAKKHLENAKENIATVINCEPEQIVFTSGGTEANNLAIFGSIELFANYEKKEKHIITTKIEHSAIKEPLEFLEKNGWKVSWLNVDEEGFIDFKELKALISPKTFLLSVIHANNEIGTVQNLNQISSLCKENNVLFHTDAVQSFGKIPVNLKETEIDFLSLSGHKIYGPKGVGALYVRNKNCISSIQKGGKQQFAIRPGTENLPGIAGFGLASKLINNEMHQNAIRLRMLQIRLMEKLANLQNIKFTGVGLEKISENLLCEKYLYRIPGHVSLCCRDLEGENLVLQADLRGLAISSGSACSALSENDINIQLKHSHVLEALKIDENYLKGSLRISLGKENTQEDVDYIYDSISSIVNLLSSKSLSR